MKLGIITWIKEKDFQKAVENKLECIELCVNSSHEEFFAGYQAAKVYSEKYHLPIVSVGRWGTERICEDGEINEKELAIEFKLIESTAYLGCPVYVTGCNYNNKFSYYENITFAITYFEKLIEHGKKWGVKIATYNCRWNNFIHSDPAWTLVHGYLKELGIKYDTSHCIYAGGDYLAETKKWADRFLHVHIKGALIIEGERYDDPPAGLDQTDWRSFVGMLYAKGYEGALCVEPHSENWSGELGEKGVALTIRYIRSLML